MKPIKIGRKGFLETQGESIYFESYGEGETILLGHGAGGNHASWFNQVPILAQDYHVVTWSQRGFGRSTNSQDKASPSAAAEDIQALLDHLGIARAHLVGQSMGGWAVLEATLRWPERVKSLTLADTIGGIFTPEIEAGFDASRARRAAKPVATTLSMDGHAVLDWDSAEANLTRAFLYQQLASLAPPRPANTSASLRETSYALNAVRAITTPTLFIVGEHDDIFPPAMIRQAAACIPGAIVVEIPDADHSPYFETPERFNQTLLTFLDSLK